jgi:hypothetical protein
MSGINTGKVITGGLLAGLVFNVIDFVINGMIMKADFAANATRLGLDPALLTAPAVIATWVIVDFIFGLVTVFTYAAIRPRFGAGPKTAVYAGLIPWLAVTSIMFALTQSAFFTTGIFGKMLVLTFVNTCIGSVVGAWAYKEG